MSFDNMTVECKQRTPIYHDRPTRIISIVIFCGKEDIRHGETELTKHVRTHFHGKDGMEVSDKLTFPYEGRAKDIEDGTQMVDNRHKQIDSALKQDKLKDIAAREEVRRSLLAKLLKEEQVVCDKKNKELFKKHGRKVIDQNLVTGTIGFSYIVTIKKAGQT